MAIRTPINSLRYGLEKIRLNLASLPFEASKTISIFGTPRSGTTWLMELLEKMPRYISLFEPLHPDWFSPPLETNRSYMLRPFLNPDQHNIEFKNYLESIFRGEVISRNPHFKWRHYLKRFYGQRLIVKFIRGNRILPWITNNFNLRGEILIIRHPCSTIASQFKSGVTGYVTETERENELKGIDIKLEMILSEIKNVVPQRIYESVKKLDDKESIYAVSWVLDYYIPLYYRKKYNFLVVPYEELVKNGRKELDRIMKYLDVKDIPDKIYNEIEVPSKTAKRDYYKDKEDYYKKDKEKQLSKWKEHLSPKQQENIFQILELFDIDFYSESIYPHLDRLRKWKGEWRPNYNK